MLISGQKNMLCCLCIDKYQGLFCRHGFLSVGRRGGGGGYLPSVAPIRYHFLSVNWWSIWELFIMGQYFSKVCLTQGLTGLQVMRKSLFVSQIQSLLVFQTIICLSMGKNNTGTSTFQVYYLQSICIVEKLLSTNILAFYLLYAKNEYAFHNIYSFIFIGTYLILTITQYLLHQCILWICV